MELKPRDRRRLEGVHPDLVRVVEEVAKSSVIEFMVLEGLRTLDRQRELLLAGATRTMDSRHITGHAVDLAPVVNGRPRWDWPLYDVLGSVVKRHAARIKVPIVWGGDWTKFRDGPHFELPRSVYPVNPKEPS